jgi:chemotaxis protein CheD
MFAEGIRRYDSIVRGFEGASDDPDSLMRKYLLPGDLFATRVPHEITTVLGSCVAVCLWDPILRAGGMNHFMLPAYAGNGEPSNRYGDIAIRNLVMRMDSLGSRRGNLKAKVYGGGNVLCSTSDSGLDLIGLKNVAMAREGLSVEGVEVLNEQVGRMQGRKLRFNTHTGALHVEHINTICERKGSGQ